MCSSLLVAVADRAHCDFPFIALEHESRGAQRKGEHGRNEVTDSEHEILCRRMRVLQRWHCLPSHHSVLV